MSTYHDISAPRTCAELLRDHMRTRRLPRAGTFLRFLDVPVGKDVYNVTAPFSVGGKRYLAGRMESRGSDWLGEVYDPCVTFFFASDDSWVATGDASTFSMEDPAVTRIGDELILSGIEVYDEPHKPFGREFRTVFFRGRSPSDFRRFAEGPAGMKDIRLVELEDGTVGVFTRPQGGTTGLGKIGFTKLPELDALDASLLETAPLIADCFAPSEWGGVNQAIALSGSRIGCIGHIACKHGDGTRHYYAMAFEFDAETRDATPLRIIVTRADFPAALSKSPDIDDCLFPGGIVRHGDGTATLYAGVADAYGGSVRILDPFAG